MYTPDVIKEAARDLRKNMTIPEKNIWNELKNRNIKYKFLRQKPIYVFTEDSWLDRYVIPDFCCLELKIIIEIDGSIHDKNEIYQLDREKEKLLEWKWFKIIRIRNEVIALKLDTVIDMIKSNFISFP